MPETTRSKVRLVIRPHIVKGIPLIRRKGIPSSSRTLHLAGQDLEDVRDHHELDVDPFALGDDVEQGLVVVRSGRR